MVIKIETLNCVVKVFLWPDSTKRLRQRKVFRLQVRMTPNSATDRTWARRVLFFRRSVKTAWVTAFLRLWLRCQWTLAWQKLWEFRFFLESWFSWVGSPKRAGSFDSLVAPQFLFAPWMSYQQQYKSMLTIKKKNNNVEKQIIDLQLKTNYLSILNLWNTRRT